MSKKCLATFTCAEEARGHDCDKKLINIFSIVLRAWLIGDFPRAIMSFLNFRRTEEGIVRFVYLENTDPLSNGESYITQTLLFITYAVLLKWSVAPLVAVFYCWSLCSDVTSAVTTPVSLRLRVGRVAHSEHHIINLSPVCVYPTFFILGQPRFVDRMAPHPGGR